MTVSKRSRIVVAILFLSLLSIDFISKILATAHLPLYTEGSKIVLTPFTDSISFLLVHHYKSMSIYGLSHNLGLIFMGFLALYFLYGAFNFPKTYQRIAFAIYLGGYGNILEIAYRDYATDFLYFTPLNTLFGDRIFIFNFADMVITLSIAVFIFGLIYDFTAKFVLKPKKENNLNLE